MEILRFFCDNWKHFIQLCFIILLICPWHWTSVKKHVVKFDIPISKQAKKEEKESIKAHG